MLVVDFVCSCRFLTKINATVQLFSLNPEPLSKSLWNLSYEPWISLLIHYSVRVIGFGEIPIYINMSNICVLRCTTVFSSLWSFTILYNSNVQTWLFSDTPWPLSFRTVTLTKLSSHLNQKSGLGMIEWFPRSAHQCFQVGTIKIQCHCGSP